jgi:hypothetical protein
VSRTASEDLRDLATEYRALKQSSEALKNDTFHALYSMPLDDLARIAFDALETVEDVDTKFGYTLAMLEQHVECSDDGQLGWVVSQSQPDGGFNKHCKTIGGYTPENGPSGDELVFHRWKDAKAALEHMRPEIRPNFRLYPVVVIAGHEPRTTSPREELL